MIVRTKIATAMSVALFAVSGTVAAEVTLYDYTEASSAYEDAGLTGSFSAADGNGRDQASYSAKLDVDYNRVISSANRNLELNAAAGGSVSRGSTAGDSSTSSYTANVKATVDNYFQPDSKGLYWYGSGGLGLEKGAEEIFSKVGVGLGYGRVVDVTPMAKAMRVIEALRMQGSLSADPSKATYQKVAKIISLQSEYQSKFRQGNYEQQWIADIEKALGSLGAGGVIEVHDVLTDELIFTRRHGWKVYGGLGLILSNLDGTDGGDPTLDIGGEYHRPLNNKTQFSNTAELSSIFGDDDTGFRLSNEMELTHEVSDKIDWKNTWLLSHNVSGEDGGVDSTTNSLTSIFGYHLNNKLDLTVTGAATNGDLTDGTDLSLNIGTSYRLR
jgi:hypothetical protein